MLAKYGVDPFAQLVRSGSVDAKCVNTGDDIESIFPCSFS